MMISEAMNGKLNKQIALEFSSAHAYLAMACAFDQMALKVLAKRFFAQADEERQHGMKILDYVQGVGGTVQLDAIPKPQGRFETVEAIVKAALGAEEGVTRQINDLVGLAESEHDYTTRSFLQWFLDEQVEEVSSMSDLLALVRMAGSNLLQIEEHVRHMMAEQPA